MVLEGVTPYLGRTELREAVFDVVERGAMDVAFAMPAEGFGVFQASEVDEGDEAIPEIAPGRIAVFGVGGKGGVFVDPVLEGVNDGYEAMRSGTNIRGVLKYD